MMISTRGRYALRVMIDLAQHSNGGYIPMKDVARRQGISLKYLERILPALTKEKLVDTIHGKGGGYRLVKDTKEYTIWEILETAEGNLAPVECLGKNAEVCEKAGDCMTLPLWKEYYELTREFFLHKTLDDMVRNPDVLQEESTFSSAL